MTWTRARRIVQSAVLLLFAAPLLASGWPLFGELLNTFFGATSLEVAVVTPAALPFFGSLSSSQIAGFMVSDPFATLEVIAASKAFNPAWLLAGLAPLLLYALIGGRFFCGWICPVNLILELVDYLAIKLSIKLSVERPERLFSRHTKIGVAVIMLLISLVTGKLIFENLSPLGFLTKVVLFGSLTGATVFVAIVLLELFVARRIWCRSLCPIAALYQICGRFGLLKVHSDYDSCVHCGKCSKVCLADPVILEPCLGGHQSKVVAGDCLRCGKCIDVCPCKTLAMRIF